MGTAQPKKTFSPYIVIRKSRIHSNGVFAKQDIAAGTRIIEYVGEKLTKPQAIKRADIFLQRHARDKANGAVYLFELNKRYDIDGDVPYNTAKNINHSCDPNCETDIIRGHIWIIAKRDIKKGEEITYNYGYGFDEYEDHQCLCGSHRCMGYILAEDHWPKLKRRLTRQKNIREANQKFQAG
jgi:SET domain-containing protein